MSNTVNLRAFPTQYVNQFKESNNELIRLDSTANSQNQNGINSNLCFLPKDEICQNTDELDINPCFLSEAQNAKAGQEYSIFEVNRVKYTREAGLIAFGADISFPKSCLEITLCADILDVEQSKVIASFSSSTEYNVNNLNYEIQDNLALDGYTRNIAVIVYASWKPTQQITHSAAIIYYLDNDVSFLFKQTYPKKEAEFIRFNGEKIISAPDIPALMTPSLKEKYIQIALFREPDDKKDLDYLCEFGKDPRGNPYLGVPTLFTISLSGNTHFCTESVATATCAISPLSPGEGGKYIMASGASDDVKESEVKIYLSEDEVTVEMVSPWKTPFPYGAYLHPYDFSYEVELKVETLTDGEKVPIKRTLCAISSRRESGACLNVIPHISIRWGCLKEDTMISMADGTFWEIRNLFIGAFLKSPTSPNGFCRVSNVWRGREDSSICVTLHNLTSVICTKTHPFMTESGFKRAEHLAIGEKIITLGGSTTVSEISTVNEEVFVYNLSVDNGGGFYANEVGVGDFEVENSNLSSL